MGTIFLTSAGLSSKNISAKFEEISASKNLKKAVIITTAASEKEKNPYAQLALSQLEAMGFVLVDFYDLENEGAKDLSAYDVIYVCGGNTFKLMKYARDVNFDTEIKALLNRGGIYIGVSAGSLILGPSIKIAGEINPDKNEEALTNLDGFNLIDFVVFPHYVSEVEEEIKAFEVKNKISVERISNAQAVIITGAVKSLIE